ncbi:MAG: hypothetical protein N2318_03740 [Meiothermus sp.]|nr:hypothetical protein [Meiothermus sp.]
MIVPFYFSVHKMRIKTKLFTLEQIGDAHELANRLGAQIFTWKTVGSTNWLEKGTSIVDALGYVVLPKQYSDIIELPDDEEDDSAYSKR